jgi:hypothetical protein
MNQTETSDTKSLKSCWSCGSLGVEGKRYCGDCGSLYQPSAKDVIALVDQRLKEKLKDQTVVEVQIAQAIAARAAEWAKLFGLFVAAPLGLLLAILSLLGVRQYSDFVKMVDSRKIELTKQIEATRLTFDEASNTANTAKAEGAKLTDEIAQLRKEVENTQASQLRKSVELLATRVSGIERRFKIDSKGISPNLQRVLTSSLSGFADYLEKIGFDTKSVGVNVKIDPSGGLNAFYSITEKNVVVGAEVSALLEKDPSTVMWPYMQHVLFIANQPLGNTSTALSQSLSNGFPDYFVSSYLNKPKVGEGFPGVAKGYLRNLDNQLKFTTAIKEPHEAGEIWGGAFWSIRQLLGRDAADRMFCKLWKSLGNGELSDQSGATFSRRLVSEVKALDDSKVTTARDILTRRGFTF